MKHIQKYLELRVASAGAVTETASCAEEKTDDAASFVPLWEAATSADIVEIRTKDWDEIEV